HFQTTTNIILLSMAVSDLLVGLAMMPLMIVTLDFCWHFQTTTNIILLSMAVSDLLVGLAVMPLMIVTLDFCWSGHLHLKESGHAFEDSQIWLLAREDRWFERGVKEAIYVKLEKNIIKQMWHFQTTTNIILLSMAVSDLLVGLAVMPLMIVTLDFCWSGHLHLKESGHAFEDSQIWLLAREDRWFERGVKEAIYVKLEKNIIKQMWWAKALPITSTPSNNKPNIHTISGDLVTHHHVSQQTKGRHLN
ncbi:hypothetical protein D4764_0190390, partial [Takifugu flavidus]